MHPAAAFWHFRDGLVLAVFAPKMHTPQMRAHAPPQALLVLPMHHAPPHRPSVPPGPQGCSPHDLSDIRMHRGAARQWSAVHCTGAVQELRGARIVRYRVADGITTVVPAGSVVLGVLNSSVNRSELRVPCQPPARPRTGVCARRAVFGAWRARKSSGGSVSAGSELPASGWTHMIFGGANGRLPREPEHETDAKTAVTPPPSTLAP
jgi:hypothetical protein